MFNKNEMILDRVRYLVSYDLASDEAFMRLTSLEDPSLNCTAEGEEVTDAIGAVITTMYRAKKATFSATNSLISTDLAAAQYGTKKEVASEDAKIVMPKSEILTIAEDGTVQLSKKPVDATAIKYIYSYVNNDLGTTYKAGTAASATEFVVDENGKITVPTGLKGKVWVRYDYETTEALRIVNKSSNFPKACKLEIYAYFRDMCNENLLYSGVIVCPKAKLNPEQIELALTSTGKHAFEFTMMKDYCNDEDILFSIFISED